jgi:hypothetical protein
MRTRHVWVRARLVGVAVLGEGLCVDVGGGAFAPGQGVEAGRMQIGEQRLAFRNSAPSRPKLANA